MPTNPNEFCEQPRSSGDLCGPMRRINALESFVHFSSTPVVTFGSSKTSIAGASDGTFYATAGASLSCYDTDGTLLWGPVANAALCLAVDSTDRLWGLYDSGTALYARELSTEDGSTLSQVDISAAFSDFLGAILREAVDLAVDDGGFWVAYNVRLNILQPYKPQVARFDRDWASLGRINVWEDGAGDAIYSVAGDDAGNVFVTIRRSSLENASLYKYDEDWALADTWIEAGYWVVRHFNGRLYVESADSGVYELWAFSTDLLKSFLMLSAESEAMSNIRFSVNGNRLFHEDVGVFETSQTEWYWYEEHARHSLGTPDGGVSVPDLNALEGKGFFAQQIFDVRDAIEALAVKVTNADSGNLFNFTDSDPDNLYYVAMGDRTEFGATGGARYTWTHTAVGLAGSYLDDITIGEVHRCLAKLEENLP